MLDKIVIQALKEAAKESGKPKEVLTEEAEWHAERGHLSRAVALAQAAGLSMEDETRITITASQELAKNYLALAEQARMDQHPSVASWEKAARAATSHAEAYQASLRRQRELNKILSPRQKER